MSSAIPRHPPKVVSIDFELEWLIQMTRLRECIIAKRRLNAIESVVTGAVRRWRNVNIPLEPVQELRVSEPTMIRLLEWVDAENTTDPATIDRLTLYASGALSDAEVRDGWVRLVFR